MKKSSLFSIIIVAATFITISACKRDFIIINNPTIADSSFAYVKLVDASPYFRQVTGAADSFNVFFNGVKVNGPALSYNSLFPIAINSGSTATNLIVNSYLAVAPGTQTIKLSVAGVVNPDSIPILSITKTLVAGRLYSLLVTDSIKSARDSAQIFVQDFWTAPSAGYINVRLMHAVLNDTVGKTVDLYSYAKNATIFTGIKPGQTTAFSTVGYNIQTPDTFYVTRSGVPAATPLSGRTILAKLLFNSISTGAVPQRTFTLYFKGDGNLTSGTKGRSLASYINQ
jgi:hypothetical protein